MATIINLTHDDQAMVVYDILDTLTNQEAQLRICRELMDRHDLTEAEYWEAVKKARQVVAAIDPS